MPQIKLPTWTVPGNGDVVDVLNAWAEHGDFAGWCATQTPPIDPPVANNTHKLAYMDYEIRRYTKNLVRAYRGRRVTVSEVDIT